MASFTLIAGAALAGVGGCSGSFGRRREREGDFGTDCVRGRSEGGTRPDEDWDGFALVDDTVRGRAAGDFGGRRIEGDAVGRGEGLAGGVGWSRRVAGRAPEVERETGRRDLVGLGRFERALPVPVEDAITVTLTLNALASVDLTTRVSSVRFGSLVWPFLARFHKLRRQSTTRPENHCSSIFSWQTTSYPVSIYSWFILFVSLALETYSGKLASGMGLDA